MTTIGQDLRRLNKEIEEIRKINKQLDQDLAELDERIKRQEQTNE